MKRTVKDITAKAARAAVSTVLAFSMVPATAMAESVQAAVPEGITETSLQPVVEVVTSPATVPEGNATFTAYTDNTTVSMPLNAIDPKPDGYAQRLIVGLEAGQEPTPGDIVLASYGDVYLLGYDNAGDLSKALERYSSYARFASIDGILEAQEEASAAEVNDAMMAEGTEPMKAGETPLDALAATRDGKAPESKALVALVDTGVEPSRQLKGEVSVIGDDLTDNNGHGTAMYDTIRAEDPSAEVLSIKAIDDDGLASVSAAYAAIEYAAASGAKIVNLSFSAKAHEGCAAIDAAVADATAANCTVVVAAGNDGDDASLYSPANAPGALTVGAMDANGKAIPMSNWGPTVDLWVEAPTTSHAAARATGRISAAGKADIGVPAAEGADGSLAEPAGETKAERGLEEYLADASHASFTLYSNIASTSATDRRTSTVDTAWRSQSAGGYAAVTSVWVSGISNNPGGSAAAASYSAAGVNWQTHFRMWLSGNMAAAYNMSYEVHGLNQSGNGSRTYNGAWATHNSAAIDGIGHQLVVKGYAHTVQARFQQADGSWSGYSQQRSGSYGYLATVPAWSRNADATYKAASMAAYTASFAAKANYVDVYRQSYTATFDSQGGADCSDAERTLLCGAALGELPDPGEITGYTFAGWYTAAEGGTAVTAESAMPTNDQVYYAHWTPNTCSISYEGMEGADGGANHPETGTYDETTTIDNPTKTGYTFTGWSVSGMDDVEHTYGDDVTNESEIGNTTATSFKNLRSTDGTVTFTAHWSVNHYSARFLADGGEGDMADQVFTYDEPQALDPNEFDGGENRPFSGWSDEEGGAIAYHDAQEVSNLEPEDGAVHELHARYANTERLGDVVLSIDANDGSGRTQSAVFSHYRASAAGEELGGPYGALLDTVQSYTFPAASKVRAAISAQTASGDDWAAVYAGDATPSASNAAESETGPLGGQAGAASTVDVEGNTAKVYFHTTAQGAYYGYRADLYGLESGFSEPFSSPGATFLGWAEDPDADTPDYTDLMDFAAEYPDGGSKELHAIWSYAGKVYFDPNGGKGNVVAASLEDGEDTLELPECSFSYPGRAFMEWNTKADGTGDGYLPGDEVDPGEGFVLYAIWDPLQLVFTYPATEPMVVAADGTLTGPTTSALGNLSDYGIKVTGLRSEALGGVELVEGEPGYEQYTLSVTPDGGSEQGLAGYQNDDYTAPANLNDWLMEPGEELGITFAGRLGSYGAIPADGMPVGRVHWRVAMQSGEVSYDSNGAEGSLVSQDVTRGDTFIAPEPAGLSKRYCEFAGWSTDPDGLDAVYLPGDSVPVDEDMTLYAVWENALGFDVDSLSWASSSETVLRAALAAHYDPDIDFDISEYVNVGDVRTVTMSTIRATSGLEKHVSQQVQLVVVDTSGAYDLADGSGKAALVVQQANALASGTTLEGGAIDPEGNPTAEGWAALPRSSWLSSTYRQALPTALRSLAKQVNVACEDKTVQSYAFLPSATDVFGGEGQQLGYYGQGAGPVKNAGARGAACAWWLRTASGSGDGTFLAVGADGTAYAHAADEQLGIAPCFCL